MGDEDMGVKVRIAGPAAAVLEGSTDEAVGLDDDRSAVAAAHTAGEVFLHAEGGADRFVVGGLHFASDLRGAQGVQERDGLRRAEGGVVADDLRRVVCQPGAGRGSPTVEDGVQRLASQLAGDAEQLRAPADPSTRALADAGVVLVEAPGDGVLVVLLLAGVELGQAQHRAAAIPRVPRPPRPRPAGRPRNPGASASLCFGACGTAGRVGGRRYWACVLMPSRSSA